MSLREILKSKVDLKVIPAGAFIREAARRMLEHGIGSLLVIEGDREVGIVTETDIARRCLAKEMDPDKMTVASCMSAPLVTCDVNSTIMEMYLTMAQHRIRHVVIEDQGEIIGIISVRDLLVHFKGILEGLGQI